jgi:hypothetical protein
VNQARGVSERVQARERCSGWGIKEIGDEGSLARKRGEKKGLRARAERREEQKVRWDGINWEMTGRVRGNVGERSRIGIECGDPRAYSCSGLSV